MGSPHHARVVAGDHRGARVRPRICSTGSSIPVKVVRIGVKASWRVRLFGFPGEVGPYGWREPMTSPTGYVELGDKSRARELDIMILSLGGPAASFVGGMCCLVSSAIVGPGIGRGTLQALAF